MDIEKFYEAIWAPQGHRALAIIRGKSVHHSFHATNEAFLAAVARTGKSADVYHGCATYKTTESRKGDNVETARALWVDLDVGPTKPYDTQEAALAAITAFTATLGIEQPWLVSSGYGVHVYYALTEPVPPLQWKTLAKALAQRLDAHGVRYDRSRMQDIASILRVPGTFNLKNDDKQPVVLLQAGGSSAATELLQVLSVSEELAPELPALLPRKEVQTNDLVGTPGYAPSRAARVIRKCSAVRTVIEKEGDTSYELWWSVLGVLKHCADGEEFAARATARREETGHAKHDWQKVLTEWAVGPTTCAKMSEVHDGCGSCLYRLQKNGSPVIHGTETAEITPPSHWVYKDPVVVQKVRDKTKVAASPDGRSLLIPSDEEDRKGYNYLSTRYWQVGGRVRGEDGVWRLEIWYDEYKGEGYQTFLLDSSFVSAIDMLKREFSARELHILGGTKGVNKAIEKIRYEQELLHEMELEVKTYPLMGWVTENNVPRGTPTGEFVLGSTLFSPSDPPQEILLSDRVYQDLRVNFKTAGTVERWVTIVDNIYNRPGAEAYQFIIAAMFASPLVALVPGSGAWHGIPIALYGDSGAAKTSTALVGLSIYAPPQTLLFNANSQKDGQGDTVNAFAIKVGTLQNIPFVADEMTGLEAEKMSAIMYMLANGKSKDRAAPNGQLIPNPHRWDLISIATGNEGFHAKLEQLRNRNTQEASMLRCFEIPLKEQDIKAVFPDVSRDYVENELLAQQYGVVGRKWIAAVVKNRIKIMDLLAKERAKLKIDNDDRSSIRFYKDLLVTVRVASLMAKRMGLINWDVERMMSWAKQRVENMAKGIYLSNWEGTISEFVASLHGRTIVTKTYRFGPGRRSANKEMPLEPLSASAVPVARRAIEDKAFVVTKQAFDDWCKDNKLTSDVLITEMKARGYFNHKWSEPFGPRLLNIGSGSTIPRPQAPCYVLDYDKCVEYVTGDETETPDNVVELPSRVAPVETQTEQAV